MNYGTKWPKSKSYIEWYDFPRVKCKDWIKLIQVYILQHYSNSTEKYIYTNIIQQDQVYIPQHYFNKKVYILQHYSTRQCCIVYKIQHY